MARFVSLTRTLFPQGDRAIMDPTQVILLMFLSFAEAGSLTILELYYIHGTVRVLTGSFPVPAFLKGLQELFHSARRLGAWKPVTANGAST